MNTIKLLCENPDELIAGFGAGARIHLQTAATEAGAYTDVTTVALVAATRSYTYEHLAGISSTWYKVRFEDATGANANDYGAPFQVGDETAGLLCSLYDVQQELGQGANANDDELILEKIRQVSRGIESYIGQWMAPRPTNPSSTTTLLFDVPWSYSRRDLLLVQGPRLTGIRTVSALGTATISQPDAGGSYTAATLSDVIIRPRPSLDGPGLRVGFNWPSTGPVSFFYPGANTVQITGSFGYAEVPADIQGVAIRAVTRRFIGKGGGGTAVAVGPNGTEILLPDMSGADRVTLQQYRVPPAA